MMDVNVIYCGPESGNLMSCGVWMIYGVASVVCHSRFCNRGLGVLSGITLRCFYRVCAHPFVAIWSGLCKITMAGAVMSTISRLWSVPVSPFLIFLAMSRVWSSVVISMCFMMWCWCSNGGILWGSPWQYVHIHHIYVTWWEGSVMQRVLVLGIENIIDIMLTIEDGMIVMYVVVLHWVSLPL